MIILNNCPRLLSFFLFTMQHYSGTRIVNPCDHKEKLNADGEAFDFARKNNYTAFTRASGGNGHKRVFYYFSNKPVSTLKKRVSIKMASWDSFMMNLPTE